MTVRLSICYGTPDDPAAFAHHYTSVHIPLADAVPGLIEFTWGTVDSLDGSTPPYHAVANMYFDDADSLAVAVGSPEMRAAGRDLRNFATGGVTMFTQEEIPVRARRP